MILIVHSWYCTLCDYQRRFDPAIEVPPEKCSACGEGTGYQYNKNINCVENENYEADK